MAMRGRVGGSDKTVMGASCTGSYEVTATRPDARSTAPPDAADKSQPRQQASVATQGQTTPDDTDNILTVGERLTAQRRERGAGRGRMRSQTIYLVGPGALVVVKERD